MKHHCTIPLILLLLLAYQGVMAQGKVTGRVVDAKSSEPIEYASVALLSAKDSSLVAGMVSEGKGTFSVKAAYGRYILRVSFMGYTSHFQPIALSEKQPTVQVGKVMLTPSVTIMNEVVVKGERTMVEYQLDKRVVNVDKNLVSSGGTATDVLQQVPSVSVDNDGSVTLRGSSNVKVLINGRPYELLGNDLETLLEQTPATSVESVEVITNPSAKYDPEGMSGIINIKLKDKTAAALGLNGMANINFGTPLPYVAPKPLPAVIPTAMGSINLNYTTEKYNLFLTLDGGERNRASHGHTDIERLRNGMPASHDILDQYSIRGNTMGSMKLGGEYYFNEQNSLLFSYQLRGGNRHRTSQMLSSDQLYSHYLDYRQTDTSNTRNINHTLNLSYVKRFDQKDRELTADATFSTRQVHGHGLQEQLYGNALANYDNYFLRESESENHHQTVNLKVNYVHPFAEVWKLETGYEGRMEWPNQNAIYYRTEYDPISLMEYRYLDSISSTHFDYTQQVHGAYATVGGKITDKLSAQAGLRMEYSYLLGYDVNHPGTDSVRKSYWEPYPTVHLSYAFDEHHSMQLSYSRRVRRPHMWDLNPYLEVREGMELGFGNPNLDPEFTNAYEISYNLSLDKWNIYTCGYFRQTTNMMTRYGYVWDSVSQQRYSWWMPYNAQYDGYWASTWQNLDRGYNYGLEFIVDYQPFKWWKLNASINLYRSTIEGTALLDNKTTSAFQASGKFSSFMTLPKDWTVQISGQYFAPYLDLQTTMYPSYWCDVAVKKDVLNHRGTINLRMGDVFCTGGWGHETFTDQINRVVTARRISPTITVGFSYKINNGLKQRSAAYDEDSSDGGEY